MRGWVGTSGYSYKEWKGDGLFYPRDLPQKEMLRHYGQHFASVEINNTFYRLPRQTVLSQWAEQVPADFRFALKASQRITHHRMLRDADELLGYLLRAVAVLGDRLGPLLFQLPPSFKKDAGRLEAFLQLTPRDRSIACEFRHASWFDDEVYQLLADRDAALCVADDRAGEIVSTASWGYLRMRRVDYDDRELAELAERIGQQSWRDVYAYFKHESTVDGVRNAERLALRLRSG